MAESNETLIVLTSGKQDRGTRATLAFSWGCAALAMGREVSIFLTMDAAVWAMAGVGEHVQVHGFESVQEYLQSFMELGGRLLVCAPCTEFYCSPNDVTKGDGLVEGAELVGLATVVQVSQRAQVVTF